MKICLAQLNYKIGDFESNTAKISETILEARLAGADLVVFSELSVCGYSPEDFFDYDWFVEKCEQSLEAVANSCKGIAAIVGGVVKNTEKGRGLFNVACFLNHGRIERTIKKSLLPTYDVFNEARYFEAGIEAQIIEFKGVKLGIAICEDLWDNYNDFQYKYSPVAALKEAGAQLIIHPSASPFNLQKEQVRNGVFTGNTERFKLPIVYVNQVGAHTDLIFDGSSKAINSMGRTVLSLPRFEEKIEYVDFNETEFTKTPIPTSEELSEGELLYKALVFGIREYFNKMGFKKAILGSSGGIDSALVQCLASAALGPDNVWPILMPSEFSSTGSVEDAKNLSLNLGNPYSIIPIKSTYEAFINALEPEFKDLPFGIAEENIQARSRGVILMSLSNKFGHILLNTGNKSEMAVGYCTLYGDMCGGLAVLGDVYKTKVYNIARYINRNEEIIPTEIINKAPSAELRPGQKDSDSLPEYSLLDEILDLYVEGRKGRDEIKMLGYEASTVDKVVNLVNRNEHKRFQSPPILRVTNKAFGQGRRIPLVASYG